MVMVQGFIGAAPVVETWAASAQVWPPAGKPGNYRVHSLIVANKNAATVFVQIYDSPNGAANSNDKEGSSNPIPRYEIPVPSGEILSLTHSQFNTGLFVQAVTVQGSAYNANVLATADLKITAEGMPWPQSS